MNLLSVLRIRELYHHVAVFLPSTDVYNLSQAVGQPFTGYDRYLLQPWRDYFTTPNWPGSIMETLEGLKLNAEILVVGPHMLQPRRLSPKDNYSTRRKILEKLKLPYLNVYVVLDNAPRMSAKCTWALERQLMMLMMHLGCVEEFYLPAGKFGVGIITLTDFAPLVRYCAPGEKRELLRPARSTSRRGLGDPPPIEYIRITRDGTLSSRAERVCCYHPHERNIYITIGGFKGDRVSYATYRIPRTLPA